MEILRLSLVFISLGAMACTSSVTSTLPKNTKTYRTVSTPPAPPRDLTSIASDKDGLCNITFKTDLSKYAETLRQAEQQPSLEHLDQAARVCDDVVKKYGSFSCIDNEANYSVTAAKDLSGQCVQLHQANLKQNQKIVQASDGLLAKDVPIGRMILEILDIKLFGKLSSLNGVDWFRGQFIQNGVVVSKGSVNPVYPACALRQKENQVIEKVSFSTTESPKVKTSSLFYAVKLSFNFDRILLLCGKSGNSPILIGDIRQALGSTFNLTVLP